jgi:HAD superfamily hydrolase (TIGR01549 family)
MIYRNVKMIAFDAFGTLVEIQSPLNPYRMLLTELNVAFTPEIRRIAMTEPLEFEAFISRVARTCSTEALARARDVLNEQVESVALFPESITTIRSLRDRSVKIAVISNLAYPYGTPLKKLLSELVDIWCLSYEVGSLKPEAAIFNTACRMANCDPANVLMVGDSEDNDVVGGHAAGMRAVLIDRTARSQLPTNINALSQVLSIL